MVLLADICLFMQTVNWRRGETGRVRSAAMAWMPNPAAPTSANSVPLRIIRIPAHSPFARVTSMSGTVYAARRNARNQLSALRRHGGRLNGRRRQGPLAEVLRSTPNHTRGLPIGGPEISPGHGSIAALQSSPYE